MVKKRVVDVKEDEDGTNGESLCTVSVDVIASLSFSEMDATSIGSEKLNDAADLAVDAVVAVADVTPWDPVPAVVS